MKSLRTFSIPRREGAVVLATMAAAVLAALLSLCLGAVSLTPGELLGALSQGASTVPGRILQFVRLPRTFGALLTGAALGVSGVVIQTVLHNPLAAPNIIGVNAGAGFAVALGAVFFPGAASVDSSLFNAAIDALLAFQPDALTGYADFRVGSFASLTMARVGAAALPVAIALGGVLLMAPQLEILSLGDETAASLGLPVRLMRDLPHFIRRLTGEKLLPLLLASAFGGAAFVSLCDTLARTAFAPYELPVGVVLSFIGVPVFLWQLTSSRRHRG